MRKSEWGQQAMRRRGTAVLWLVISFCGMLYGQADRGITIKMLDSKTGKPITTSEFQVWLGDSVTSAHTSGVSPRWVKPSNDGLGKLSLPTGATVLTVHAQCGAAKWGYVNCDRLKDRGPFEEHWYSISDILTSGVTAPNFCSKQTAVAKPGEFVFFVRPMSFVEKMHQ